ncbi:MAG TPA: flagellar basal-body rod protein FlgF [candidate division Zixibacteria bacterium]|nr:flagellar basal-body rod protein FlgF [candidate division Zixibacteria bacterium]
MDAATYKALSASVTQMRRLEIVAQDLANVGTPGYKGQRLAFSEVLAERVPPDNRAGGFVAVAGERTNLGQGEMQRTADPFHLALEGDGFFVVATARGERYTRNGSFTVKSDGTLATAQGDALLGEAGPIRVTGAVLEVLADGTVRSSEGEVGRLRIVRFVDPRQAIKEGNSLFRSAAANVVQLAEPRVVQGSLELSNVNPVDGMVSLIAINRNFESYQRAMKLMDGATEKMISEGTR